MVWGLTHWGVDLVGNCRLPEMKEEYTWIMIGFYVKHISYFINNGHDKHAQTYPTQTPSNNMCTPIAHHSGTNTACLMWWCKIPLSTWWVSIRRKHLFAVCLASIQICGTSTQPNIPINIRTHPTGDCSASRSLWERDESCLRLVFAHRAVWSLASSTS